MEGVFYAEPIADITATAITVIIFVIKVRPLLKSKVMDDDLVIMK